MQAERKLVARIMKDVQKAYPHALVWKLADRFRRGMLDILIVWKAKLRTCILFVEAKTETGRLTKLQEMTIDSVPMSENCLAIVATSVKEVLDSMTFLEK